MAPKHCVNCVNKYNYNNSIPNPTPHFFQQNIQNTAANESTVPINPIQANIEKPQQMAISDNEGFVTAPGSPIILGPEYTQGYLRSIIGEKILVTFLIGTDVQTDRSGILTDVGISYIILRETETGNLVLCDIYSIKFVIIFQ